MSRSAVATLVTGLFCVIGLVLFTAAWVVVVIPLSDDAIWLIVLACLGLLVGLLAGWWVTDRLFSS
jgi:hypothetical protein